MQKPPGPIFRIPGSCCLPYTKDTDIHKSSRAPYMHNLYPESQRHMGKELYDGLGMPADACAGCGECVTRCPAGIDIPERMKEAIAAFGSREIRASPGWIADTRERALLSAPFLRVLIRTLAVCAAQRAGPPPR